MSNVKLLLFAVDAKGSGALSCAMGMTSIAVGWLRETRGEFVVDSCSLEDSGTPRGICGFDTNFIMGQHRERTERSSFRINTLLPN